MHELWTISTVNMMYTRWKNYTDWELVNMEYKHSKLWFSVVSFNRKSCDFFPASAHPLLFFDKWFVQIYSNVIQSSKQRQERNSLATIQWAKLKEAHERFISLQIVKPLKPSANPNKNNQGSHWGLSSYDRNGWKCELDGTSTSIVNFSENHETPFFVHLSLLQHSW